MLESYILLQVRNLRNIVQYLMDIRYDINHKVDLGDLDELDLYLYRLEESLT